MTRHTIENISAVEIAHKIAIQRLENITCPNCHSDRISLNLGKSGLKLCDCKDCGWVWKIGGRK